MKTEKTYWFEFKKENKWWIKPHKLTEKEAKEEFVSFGYEYRKHWANK